MATMQLKEKPRAIAGEPFGLPLHGEIHHFDSNADTDEARAFRQLVEENKDRMIDVGTFDLEIDDLK